MTPAHLRSIIQAATPGPLSVGVLGDDIIAADGRSLIANVCDDPCLKRDEDAAAIVATMNHADALCECAEALYKIRNESHWTTVHELIDATLARLEAIK
jgi:hypothetical protein